MKSEMVLQNLLTSDENADGMGESTCSLKSTKYCIQYIIREVYLLTEVTRTYSVRTLLYQHQKNDSQIFHKRLEGKQDTSPHDLSGVLVAVYTYRVTYSSFTSNLSSFAMHTIYLTFNAYFTGSVKFRVDDIA